MPADNQAIVDLAKASLVRDYRWKNRGRAPSGYVNGMAVAFAEACRGLSAGDEAVVAIAAPVADDPDHDALAWYSDILTAADLAVATPSDRLLAVFAVLIGLGMRESSGKHCEGRDMSAENVSAETAEAGLFQVSYNSRNSHPELKPLLARFTGRDDLLTVFDDDVHCSASSWKDWGEGNGRDFQASMKGNPLLSVYYAAVLLRTSRKHWGPIKRREAEVNSDAIRLLRDVASAVGRE
jgi:hypothetical protein